MGTAARGRPFLFALLVIAAATSAWLAAAQALAPAAQERPAAGAGARAGTQDKTRRDFSGDCLSAGCHAQLNRTPWVHSPVAVGACAVCHEATGAAAHDFRPARPKESLCSFCHPPPTAAAFVHEAFRDADCLGCHDPHGGATHHMLVTDDAGELCGSCHAPHDAAAATEAAAPGTVAPGAAALEVSFPFAHPPFAERKCLDCHRAHQSEHEHLLLLPERELCLGCHPRVSENLVHAGYLHEPITTECRSCHVAHGAADRRLLRAAPRELCLSCHEEVAREASAAEGLHVHGALDKEGSCLACHTPHAGSSASLVSDPLGGACYSCHDAEITKANGETVVNVAAEVRAATYQHGPVRDGRCQACHLSHSSPYPDLLTARYPEGLYEEFTETAFALCFACHDERVVTEERTTMTAFRDGDRNLHHVHVQRKKGRACGICHQAHGADQPALMRRSVPFGPGGWQLPIHFARTESGGSCASGCHQELAYDNRNPAGDPGAHLLPAATRTATPPESHERNDR
jgi:predicted CXXCH cytochrome family protein